MRKRGGGELEFISPDTFDRLLPERLTVPETGDVRDQGIGLHWLRPVKPGSPPDSTHLEDVILGQRTVGHGAASGCIFVIDLEQDLGIVQVHRRRTEDQKEWSSRFFQTIAESVSAKENVQATAGSLRYRGR